MRRGIAGIALSLTMCLVAGALAAQAAGGDWFVRGRTSAPRTLQVVYPIEELAEPELQFRQTTPEQARLINAAIPISTLPNPAAARFVLPDISHDRERAENCLTAAIYYEAALESTAGQKAVAQVVLNRVRHPAYPKTVCGVVYEGSERTSGCQFTFTCDGALQRRPVPALWERARRVAAAALDGAVFAPVGRSTHYHADYVAPYWSPTLVKVAQIGAHIFYRWQTSVTLNASYRGGESGDYYLVVQELRIAEAAPAVLQQVSLARPEPHDTLSPTTPGLGDLAQAAPSVSLGAQPADPAPAPVVTAAPTLSPVESHPRSRLAVPANW